MDPGQPAIPLPILQLSGFKPGSQVVYNGQVPVDGQMIDEMPGFAFPDHPSDIEVVMTTSDGKKWKPFGWENIPL